MRKQAGDEKKLPGYESTTHEAMFTRAFGGTWTKTGSNNAYSVTYPDEAHYNSMAAFLQNAMIPHISDKGNGQWSLSIQGTAPTTLNVLAQMVDPKTFHDPQPHNWQRKVSDVEWPERKEGQSAIDHLREVNVARGISYETYVAKIKKPDLHSAHDKSAIGDFLNTLKLRERDNSWSFDRPSRQFKLAIPAAEVEATTDRAIASGFNRDELTLQTKSWGKELLLSAETIVNHPDYVTHREKYDAALLHNAEHGVYI